MELWCLMRGVFRDVVGIGSREYKHETRDRRFDTIYYFMLGIRGLGNSHFGNDRPDVVSATTFVLSLYMWTRVRPNDKKCHPRVMNFKEPTFVCLLLQDLDKLNFHMSIVPAYPECYCTFYSCRASSIDINFVSICNPNLAEQTRRINKTSSKLSSTLATVPVPPSLPPGFLPDSSPACHS